MKAVVFGASGMIGKYLIPALLKNKYDVIAADRTTNGSRKHYFSQLEVDSFQVDITKKEDFENLPTNGIDIVIHLSGIMPASMQGYSPEKYFIVNTIGTMNILNYCREVSAKQIVYLTSHSDFAGYWGNGNPIDPYAPPKYCYGNDHSVYSVSKRAAVEVIKNAFEEFGIEYNIFRCPNIYAWDSPNEYYVDGVKRTVGWKKIIARAIKGERLEIWGNSQNKRDLVYIKDLLQMILLSLKCPEKNNIFNVSNGTSSSLEEQILTIAKVFNPASKKSEIVRCPEKQIHISNHHYDITNAVTVLGYKPQYFLYEMFEDMKKEMQLSNSNNLVID